MAPEGTGANRPPGDFPLETQAWPGTEEETIESKVPNLKNKVL